MSFKKLEPVEAWAARQVHGLPQRWSGALLRTWGKQRAGHSGASWIEAQDAETAANVQLRAMADQLAGVPVSLDASDAEVCAHASVQADRCAEMAGLYHLPELLRRSMERIAEGQGVDAPGGQYSDMGAIRRMTDPLWWRRAIRRAHAKRVEAAAIQLGYVNKRRDIYISDESLKRRMQQNERNRQALQNTIATNEDGQEYTLAELAATGPANKAIRRAELMTRISGFERIANELGHEGLFFTVTCPSRMHKWATARKGGGVFENPRYDGTTPREAQAYLAKVWARIRAALKRQGLSLYGFRIAEPNHDGTPHWHLLVFHEAGKLEAVKGTVWRYALADSATEPGAARHRCDFKPIDRERGSAAGYIAKYVAKNIDGYRVESDLYGNDAMETSARVEAWAATWGIRQFQQVGGPPVTVWRELRRVKEIPANAPDFVHQAHNAVNRVAVIEGRQNASVAWDHYCKAQGGVFCGRGYRIKVAKVQGDGLGRYGEPEAAKPIGVETVTREIYTPDHMRHMKTPGMAVRVVHWLFESVRRVWSIATRREKKAESAQPIAPWTCVNNCTAGERKASEADQAQAVKEAQELTDSIENEIGGQLLTKIWFLEWVSRAGGSLKRGQRGSRIQST